LLLILAGLTEYYALGGIELVDYFLLLKPRLDYCDLSFGKDIPLDFLPTLRGGTDFSLIESF